LVFALAVFVSFGECIAPARVRAVEEVNLESFEGEHLFARSKDDSSLTSYDLSMDTILDKVKLKLEWEADSEDDDDDDDDRNWKNDNHNDASDHAGDDNYDKLTNTPGGVSFIFPKHPDSGNLSDVDRILMDRVRLAGLWEIPGGLLGLQKGTTNRVRHVGRLLAYDHSVLDNDVRRVAAFFGHPLPNEPNADQQTWLGEFKTNTGDAFNHIWADRLRAAHGSVYQALALVHANTRNNVIRFFAKHCERYVSRHMWLLETTGFVDFNALPPLKL